MSGERERLAQPACRVGHGDASSRVEIRPGDLPVGVTQVVFLMVGQFQLAVFARDGLEAFCADGIDRGILISSVSKWG
jgi:hypothetical protein